MKFLLILLALSSVAHAEILPIRNGNGIQGIDIAKPVQHRRITITPYAFYTSIKDDKGNSATIVHPPVRSHLYPVIDLNGNGVLLRAIQPAL